MTKEVKKATRKITKLDFSGNDHSIALVGPVVGGPANGYETLITKSTRSEEFIKKASMVNVEMEITEFLRKFFYMYSDDAEVLARALGYTTAMQDDETEDAAEGETDSGEMESGEMESGDWEEEYAKYIEERVASFTIMKSLNESKDIAQAISELSDDDFLSVLSDQETIEKSGCVKKEKKPIKKSRKETKLTTKTKETTEPAVEVEVQKSVHEVELEKAQLELKKALEELEVFKQREKETKLTGRKQEIVKAVGVEEQALAIFEGVKDSSDEVFAGVVKALADISKAVVQSDLFNETGTTVEDNNDGITVDGVEKILKAKYTINK